MLFEFYIITELTSIRWHFLTQIVLHFWHIERWHVEHVDVKEEIDKRTDARIVAQT